MKTLPESAGHGVRIVNSVDELRRAFPDNLACALAVEEIRGMDRPFDPYCGPDGLLLLRSIHP